MTVKELSKKLELTAVTLPDGDREVTGCYIGDLLSWVMGAAKSGDAWITIMSNINIVAVATLVDVSCIILAEDVTPDENILNTAVEKGVNILSTQLPAYEASIKLSEILS